MDDRIAEIREALARPMLHTQKTVEVPHAELEVLTDAAREHLALLDSDALIIRRDADGKWPEWAILVWDRWWLDKDEPGATALFDALASSQGVEP